MGKKYKRLMPEITDIDNIRDAYKKAVKGGNRYTLGHLRFKENLEANLFAIKQELESGEYKPGEYNKFKVYEPKERIIKSLPFKDRVAQHAINNVIEPIFEKMFYSTSYACRKNKGPQRGAVAVQSKVRKLAKHGKVYYLKMDFSKYFHRVFGPQLFNEIKKKISDSLVLAYLKMFMGKVGIPIGNLLSQLFANLYGHIFDRFIKTKMKIKHYYRYMDDSVVIAHSKKKLKSVKRALGLFAKLYMRLDFSKWYINAISKPLNFLGYRITPGYKLIRKDSFTRAKRKIKRFVRLKLFEKLKRFLAAWLGHVRLADSFNLLNHLRKEYKKWQHLSIA